MKATRLVALAGLTLLGFTVGSTAIGQIAGDFQSFQTGDWNDVNTWEYYNGSTWVNPAPNTPTSADGDVTILGGHTVTVTATDSVDQLLIEATGTLVVDSAVTLNIEDGTGTDLKLNGTLENAGSVTVDAGADMAVGDGGIYRHAQNGGEIPSAAWGLGSTCEVTGAQGNAPGNASQNYHHFTWNCPEQSSNLNTGWDNITIGGNVTLVSSSTRRFQMTSSTYDGTVITIMGDVIVLGGALASNGSSSAATYTIEVMGDVIVDAGGNLGVSRGSGGNATWRLHGDMSVTDATIQSSNSESRFIFAKADTQTVSFSGVTTTGTFHYEVDSGTVVILADGPDTVDVTISDSLICRGEVVPVGALAFADGAVYSHDREGGSVPVATWETGSTCTITGATGGKPDNLSQDFHHFVWDCPGQSGNLDWGWANNTIGGDVWVLSSGGSRARLTSPGATPDGPNLITIMGNIVVDSAAFESNGSSSADTITIDSYGDITATDGALAVSRGSGPIVTWNVYGDFTMVNSETRNSGGDKAAFYFTKEGTQKLLLVNPTFGGGGLPIVVDSGATLNVDTSVIAGSGNFTLSAGATLETPHPFGIDGSLQMTGTISLSEGANYTFNGSYPQFTGLLMPDSVTVLTFSNPATVALTDTVACADLQVFAGARLGITDTASLTAASGTVLGLVINTGEFNGSASLIFGNGSTYRHAMNGGSIPTVTWEDGSLCEVTGTTDSAPSNCSQDFHGFTWNCPDQSSNKDWGWANNTIGGDVTVLSSGSARIRMTSPGATPDGPNVITILGKIIVENASVESNGSSDPDTITIESYGDISATGGLLAVSRGSGPMVTWNVYADLTLDNTETRNSGGEKAAWHFTKDGMQNLVLINPIFGGGGMPIVVESGATLNMDTSVVGGSGDFTVGAGAGLATAHPDGLNGSLQMTGAILLSEDADYTFNGSVAQSTGNLLPTMLNKLIIDNAAGVTLSSSVTVNDTLHLMAGMLMLGDNSVTAIGTAGGSSTAYVVTDGSGVLEIPGVGGTETHFPVGTASSYAPLWVTNAGTADDFAVSVAPDAGTEYARVKLAWDIAEATAGGSDATLKFGWMGTAESPAFAADRAGNAQIFDLADTTEAGSGDYTAQLASEPYTLSRAGFTGFSPFAVGNFTGIPTSVDEAEEIPTVFALKQNYPNPFNPTTVIRYDVPEATGVSIKIYDALGRVVTELVKGDHAPGVYRVEWDAARFASGVYYYRIVAGDFVSVKKMMLVR